MTMWVILREVSRKVLRPRPGLGHNPSPHRRGFCAKHQDLSAVRARMESP